MTLVGVVDIWQALGHLCEIPFCQTMTRLVLVVIEIGDRVSDGYPADRSVGKGREKEYDGQGQEADELFHNRQFQLTIYEIPPNRAEPGKRH